MRVVGTAGHVDHGKSTLVRALTGIDPDRLKEEKARGMTIDLGFAWVDLRLPSGVEEPIGIVDVPGHIDFIKNMLAGIGGIDAAVLVVAADEGIMPQTREHLAILDLLDAPACVVALTKVDLVDEPEWLDLVELDVEALLEETHFAQSKSTPQIVRVSASTGEGLDELRQALGRSLMALAPRRNRNRPRLPVDRVFTLSGFGAVVTGTLLDGELATGDEVSIYPARRSARIRGMQSHKHAVENAVPGSRVALNLAGVAAHDIRRGDVVARPGTLEPTQLLDVEFRLLPGIKSPLRHNQKVDLFCGASERRAVVRLLGVDTLEPGATGWLQLRLEDPVLVAAGDRFILRRPSPSMTIGGGQILHAHPRRRWKRFDATVIARFQQLAQGAPEELILGLAEREPLQNATQLVQAAGVDQQAGMEAISALEKAGALHCVVSGNESLFYTPGWEQKLVSTLTVHLARYHAEWPLRRGMPQGETRARLEECAGRPIHARVAAALLGQWQSAGHIVQDNAFVAAPEFRPAPTVDQQRAVEKTLAAFGARPVTPPNEAETIALLRNDAELLTYLLDQGVLVRLPQGVLMETATFDALVQRVIILMEEQGEIALADVRDALDTSRRYAQAILEEMDARRITRREEDLRVLRQSPGANSQ